MPGNDELITVAGEWVAKAENDLKNAAYTLGMGEDCPTDTICFHAQQCIEKYIKALLVLGGIDFPKTHDLEELIRLLGKSARISITAEELDMLTDYATGARYPGWGDISLAEARKAVRIAKRVRREIRKLLPAKALRRK
jgi:HEPN domain-containing protein